MGTLRKLGQGIVNLFKKPKKVNISEVNKSTKNTPTINNSSRHTSHAPHGVPGAFAVKMQTMSPVVKGYRCGRGFLTHSKMFR